MDTPQEKEIRESLFQEYHERPLERLESLLEAAQKFLELDTRSSQQDTKMPDFWLSCVRDDQIEIEVLQELIAEKKQQRREETQAQSIELGTHTVEVAPDHSIMIATKTIVMELDREESYRLLALLLSIFSPCS